MKKRINYYLSGIATLCTVFLAAAQTPVADSLKLLISKDKLDTNKVNHLNQLAIELWGNLDTAIICSKSALETAKKINTGESGIGWQKGIAKSYYLLGVFSFDKGSFSDALMMNMKAFAIWEELEKTAQPAELSQIKFAKAKSIGEIGNAYFGQSDYPRALEFQFKALKIYEELGHEKGVGNSLGNIGNIYSDQKNYTKALEYYLKSLKVGQKLGNKYDISIDLRNIAIVYTNMGNAAKSLEYSMMALVVSKELGNDLETANNLISVGSAIQSQADSALRSGVPYIQLKEQYDKAMDYFSQSVKLQKQQGNDFGLAMNYSNIAGIYLVQKKYNEAEHYFMQALAIDSALGSLSQIKHMHEGLSELYYQKGDYKKSILHFKLFVAAKDSLFNEEKDKEITRHEMNYEFEKKEAELKAEQDKKNALAEADKKRQNILFWLITAIAIAIAVIAMIVLRTLKITKKQKNIIEQQKEIVEEKQRELMDSIRYAKRIQQSLLPTEKYIDKQLKVLKADK
jgi:tetratricopeptide (TPR) repeat protein